MSIWPFNRRKKQQESVVASEIQDYYQAERRERKGVAWLLAIATFVVTLLIVLALFYGGKWVYNKISGDEPEVTETTQGDTSQSDQATQDNQDAQQQDQDQLKPDGGDRQVSGQSDAPQTSSTSTSTPSPSTPVTGPASEELPRTGPDQDL